MTADHVRRKAPIPESNCDDPRAIRVLHVEAGTYFGGSHRALATYLKASTATDLQHHVLLVHPVAEFETAVRGICPVTTLPGAQALPVRQPSGKAAILKFWIDQMLRIRRFIFSGGFDVVHVNNTFSFQPYTIAASRLAGVPVVAHIRNPVPDSRFARFVAKMPQTLVAVNAGLARSAQDWCSHDVQVCYDGVELGSPDVKAACRLRKELLGDGTLLIGSVGRLEFQKGYDLLLEAASEVLRTHPEVKFVIAGDGPLRAVLEKRIAELGLRGRFVLCGYRADVATFLQTLDIFVCSSRYEGGPMTVAEAIMASKPVISTPVGFVPELSCDGEYAYLVPIGDVTALTAAMKRAIVPNDVPDGAAEARSRVKQLFSPLRAAEKLDASLRTAGREEQNRKC